MWKAVKINLMIPIMKSDDRYFFPINDKQIAYKRTSKLSIIREIIKVRLQNTNQNRNGNNQWNQIFSFNRKRNKQKHQFGIRKQSRKASNNSIYRS